LRFAPAFQEELTRQITPPVWLNLWPLSGVAEGLVFQQLLALELDTDLVEMNTEEFDLRCANRLDEVPQVTFSDGHCCQNLVRRVAVVVAAFVNEEEHGKRLSQLTEKGTPQNGLAESAWWRMRHGQFHQRGAENDALLVADLAVCFNHAVIRCLTAQYIKRVRRRARSRAAAS
jgi:hypothetical protein